MGFLYLALSILLTVGWALCYKVAVKRKCDLLSVNVWVHCGATAVMLICFFANGRRYHPGAVEFGAVSGIFTYLATITFFYHIRKGVLAVSWTVIGLALVFPVLTSIILWHEQPTVKQYMGLALIPVAFILCGMKPRKEVRE